MNAVLVLSLVVLALATGLAASLWALMRAQSALAVERAQSRLGDASTDILRAQATATAEAVADQLVKRATEKFEAQGVLAQTKLEEQLKPVAQSLAKFHDQFVEDGKARAEATGGLKTQIEALLRASNETQTEARKLSTALRRGAGVQGRWGEQILLNVLESAGLIEHFDFDQQPSMDTEEGRRRPDVKVRLPGNGVIAIDAKCSLTAFLEAQEALDDATREAALNRYGQSIRAHVAGLSGKAYWDQFRDERSPDFVAMFVPGDGYLAAAIERVPDLMSQAMDRKVIIVTPTTLFALCKVVALGWRVQEQAENAKEIATLGRELYKRLSVMGAHVAGVGKSLGDAVGKYNAFVGSLEGQVLTQARRFEDLAVDHEGKSLPQLEALESAPRALGKLAAALAADEAPILTVRAG
jgi:DNA recombination protein RmuC